MSWEPETVGEIIEDIKAAVQRMGKGNPHRALLIRAGTALISMARRLSKDEAA